MDDLISRQLLISKLANSTVKFATYDDWEHCCDVIESVERKRGEWIRHDEIKNVYGGIYIECSECGEKYVVQHIEDEKYCRNCGADMRKGEEHE